MPCIDLWIRETLKTKLTEQTKLQIAQVVPVTQAEGPGSRFAIWVQGCPLRCLGCCNPEMLKFEGGETIRVEALVDQMKSVIEADPNAIEGITLLGGEPFSHAQGLSLVAQAAHDLGLTVMIFSGFLIEDLRVKSESDPQIELLLRHTDILVDGPYIREQPDESRRWIGSANQRIHFLSERYDESDSRWGRADTLEIRLNGTELTVNGFPAKKAVGVWKRPKVNHKNRPDRGKGSESEK